MFAAMLATKVTPLADRKPEKERGRPVPVPKVVKAPTADPMHHAVNRDKSVEHILQLVMMGYSTKYAIYTRMEIQISYETLKKYLCRLVAEEKIVVLKHRYYIPNVPVPHELRRML